MSFPDPFYRWRPHPWHGLDIGPDAPEVVEAYIEITPFDFIKYEVDKATGYMRVDRPQPSSSAPPVLYGFIPRTYCDRRVQALSEMSERGDRDPLDICVISERPINRGEVIVSARVVGGVQLVDGKEADDKIIAVLDNDAFWERVRELEDIPPIVRQRIQHYFATYKLMPDEPKDVIINEVYGRERAYTVIKAAQDDYAETYGH